jgi:hypothetical protein
MQNYADGMLSMNCTSSLFPVNLTIQAFSSCEALAQLHVYILNVFRFSMNTIGLLVLFGCISRLKYFDKMKDWAIDR